MEDNWFEHNLPIEEIEKKGYKTIGNPGLFVSNGPLDVKNEKELKSQLERSIILANPGRGFPIDKILLYSKSNKLLKEKRYENAGIVESGSKVFDDQFFYITYALLKEPRAKMHLLLEKR
ncbi:MAG: hypothetical protein KC516_01170 [Nanoarchaeota archaeon]|nr:hypothetical protein [Nanoarchaeota archaeon]